MIEKKRGLRRRHLPYAALALAAAGLTLWIALGNHASTRRVEAGLLNIATVRAGEFNDYVRLNGRVAPIQVVQLAPEEGGLVHQRVAEEGARVRRGDVILRLTNSSLDLQILNAEAELAEKQNLLRNTQLAMQQQRLANETESATLETDVRRKERAHRQNERLYAERLISREAWTQSKEESELALRKQSLVRQRLEQDALYRQAQMEQMEDNLANMRRNVLLVRQRKERLEVRSPIDGELGLLDAQLGQNIAPGQKVGQVNDLSAYKIEALVDEHYIDRVRQGLEATLERDSLRYRLRVRKVYPEVRGGQFRIDLVFDGPRPAAVRSGQTCYLNLQLGRPERALLIPRGTFFQTTGGRWIFVLERSGGRAYRRPIRIGRQNPQHYEVLEGLEPGERVITSGYEAFKENEVLVLE